MPTCTLCEESIETVDPGLIGKLLRAEPTYEGYACESCNAWVCRECRTDRGLSVGASTMDACPTCDGRLRPRYD